jgi:hypothetical protein
MSTAEFKAVQKKKNQVAKFRISARDWLAAADSMLKASAGVGLVDFIVTPAMEASVPPASWPGITVCIDQGTDGWSAVSFLGWKLGCNFLVLPDPSHRVWNDCMLSLKSSRLWGLTMVMAKVFGLDQGPWSDSKWYHESVEAVEVYMATSGGPTDSLFQELLPRILADMGQKERITESGIEVEVWQSLREAFRVKMQKVAMTRWFGWVSSARQMLALWHRRLLTYMYISLAQGWIQLGAAADFCKMAAPTRVAQAADADPVELPTARDLAELEQLRKKCKNSLQMSSTMLADPEVRRLVQGVVLVFAPCEAWQSEQLRALQSVSGAATHYMNEANGASLLCLRGLAGLFSAIDFWQEVGCWAPGARRPWAAEGPQHPLVLSDDATAQQLGSLIMDLVKNRFRSMVMFTRGLPWRLAGLLDVAKSGPILAWLQRLDEAWHTGVLQARGATWTRIRGRSLMQLKVVKQARLHNALSANPPAPIAPCPVIRIGLKGVVWSQWRLQV